MKPCTFILISVLFLLSCNGEKETMNLLDDPGRWKSDEPVTLEDGLLSLEGEYVTYVYHTGLFQTFENFELTAEMKSEPGAQVALLFHTNPRDLKQGYEVMIENDNVGNWDRLLKTGSLTSVRNIYYNMVDPGTWFELKIKVVENHIDIFVNGHLVVNYTEPEMPFRPAQVEERLLSSGTFAFKTLFGNTVLNIRKLDVTPLAPADKLQNADPEYVRNITQLHYRQIPVVDYHVHKKGDLTLEQLIEKAASTGVNYGIAANCGLKFPIQNDEELMAYYQTLDGLPVFKAMQAEGREWMDMFSQDLVDKFDYAFTDAMTWTNSRGVRMRLWIPEETDVGDPEDFMEQLVTQIEKVVSEPISIYVNPTFLPVEIADRYDELWTDERIDRVIQALKKNDVALEIGNRYKLPGDRVIAAAREAGVKFAMGTNNTGPDNLEKLEWALQVVEKYNLQPTEMYLPVQK